MIGTLLDKLIAPFAPGHALKRQAARHAIAQLATYAAADTGRRNADWRGSSVSAASADLAIIPDSRVLNMRARQIVRDTWVGESTVSAARRHIVGRGIRPMPAAHDGDGKPLTALNGRLQRLWKEWAGRAKHCDVERRQTFYAKQALMVEERYAVGEAFLVWSYTQPTTRRDPVGLRFQSFEPEMLDLTKQSYGTNEVRGGVEVDADGAPVAYHFWTRNPADYLYRRQMHSVRIPATRVMHYFRQRRVLQTRGATQLAPVMQDVRDLDRYKQANLWAAVMEACHGGAITRELPGGLGIATGLQPAPGDNGLTASGMRKFDFTPGMMFELAPGESVQWNNPVKPGNQYEPFTNVSLRGIGAGVGISYGTLARHFDGNYSVARQDMLEDNLEWDPEQDLFIETTVCPVYELFAKFCAMEGRLDGCEGFDLGEFILDENRFVAAEFARPAKPWIDPEKEMAAHEKALANHLRTREEIIGEMGGRSRDVFHKAAEEQALGEELGLEFPEDKRPADRRELLKTIAGSTAGTELANAIDVRQALEDEGMPIRPGQQQDVQQQAPQQPSAPGGAQPPPAKPPAAAAMGAALPDTWSDTDAPGGPPTRPPNYRLAVMPEVRCGTCSYLDVSSTPTADRPQATLAHPFCRKFNADVAEDRTCDAWAAPAVDADTNVNRGRTLPPYAAPGTAPLERNFEAPGRTSTDLAAVEGAPDVAQLRRTDGPVHFITKDDHVVPIPGAPFSGHDQRDRGKARAIAAKIAGHQEAASGKKKMTGGQGRDASHGGRSDGGGGGGAARPAADAGRHVAGEAPGAGPAGAGEGGEGARQPAGDGAAGGVPAGADKPAPAGRGAAELGKVNARIDRVTQLLRGKGQHEVAGWLDKLKGHVNGVGVEHALESLGDAKGDGQGTAQYQGASGISDFAEKYLNRAGIALVGGDDASGADPHAPVISSRATSQGDFRRNRKGDFFPDDPKAAADKLKEAQSLPGLEKSRALEPGTTHLTPEVTGKLDEEYGKGKWIVKAYGDDAAAGYGIFFPQRAEQIRRDARNTLHAAGQELGKHGFSLYRDKAGKVAGIEHQNGDRYKFGADADGNARNEKYKKTIYGDARAWADKAAKAANDEKGAALPGGGKEFMVQPAFNAVGVSEADRAAGKTIAPGEGRVHVITRNGRAEAVPHTTWIKGEHLPVVFENEDTRAMARAAQDAIDKLPHSDRQGQVYAPDVVKTDQGYKVVEANPSNHTGGSGYLTDNPHIIDSYVSHVTGRDPAHVQFIRKLLTDRK